MRGAGADGVERLWEIESNSVSIVSRFGSDGRARRRRHARQGRRQRRPAARQRALAHEHDVAERRRRSCSARRFGRVGRSRRSARDIRGAVAADSQGLGLFRVWTNVTNPPAFWGSDAAADAGRRGRARRVRSDRPTSRRRTARRKACRSSWSSRIRWSSSRDGDDILMRMEEYDTVRRIKMSSRGRAVRGVPIAARRCRAAAGTGKRSS